MIIGIFCHTRKTSVLTSEKRCTSCPKWGEGGGRGNSGNARKKTFFFSGGVPLACQYMQLWLCAVIAEDFSYLIVRLGDIFNAQFKEGSSTKKLSLLG